MILLDVLQGSKDWFAVRSGKPTSGEFDKVLTPSTLKLSSQAPAYMHRLLAERKLGTVFEVETKSWAQDRGIELEQEAVDYYQFTTGHQTRPAGFCLTDDGRAGASPDRFSGDEGLLEIKCPLLHTHIGYQLLKGELPQAYLLQTQGQLWVTKRAWVDFLSYYPGEPAVLIRTFPAPKVQDAFDKLIPQFCDQIDEAAAYLATLR